MPRDAAGNYTLPAGNPVITGTLITSTWANPTMADIGNEITNSLSRNGQGGMLVPLEFFDGTKNDPGITFTNEPNLGFYRADSGVLGVGGQGNVLCLFDATTGDVTAPSGQVKSGAAIPLDPDDLTRKDYVDQALQDLILGLIDKPVGAIEIGWDPNGVLAGTWEQWPEGTFIMNTLGGDLSGGSNDATLPEHDHSIASNGAHTHNRGTMEITGSIAIRDEVGRTSNHEQVSGAFAPGASVTSSGYGGQGGFKPGSASFAASRTWTGATSSDGNHTHQLNPSGEDPTNKNKPLYKGVAIWERTA